MRSFHPLWSLVLALAANAACSSPKPPEPPRAPDKTAARDSGPRRRVGPSVETEIGALDQNATERAFGALLRKVEKCQDDRRAQEEQLDFLSGDVKIKVRVKADGSARYAYLQKTTVGDRAVEQCIVDAAKGLSWPKPQGGEGIAENEFSLPQKGDREAVAWPATKVAKEVDGAKAQLKSCTGGKKGGFLVTAYVDKAGRVISAGASAPVEDAEGAVDCLVKAVRGLKLPSPGGFPAKVTISVD